MGKRMCLELAGRRERKSGPRQRDCLLWSRFLTVELVSQAEDSASGAVLANRRTLAPGGTRESSITGSRKSVSIRIRMEHIRCAGQKRR